jgi:hypothetical protein
MKFSTTRIKSSAKNITNANIRSGEKRRGALGPERRRVDNNDDRRRAPDALNVNTVGAAVSLLDSHKTAPPAVVIAESY